MAGNRLARSSSSSSSAGSSEKATSSPKGSKSKASICEHVKVFAKDTSTYCRLCGIIFAPPQLFSNEQWGTLVPVSDAELKSESQRHHYKRKTRFLERVRNLTGEGDGDLPSGVIGCVKKEMHKHGILGEGLTPKFVSFALKKHKRMRYHEQAFRIAAVLGDFKPLSIKTEITQQMLVMFEACDRLWPSMRQELFDKYRWVRFTFPNYTIIIFNFLVLLRQEDEARYVYDYILKTEELIHRQQFLWKIFCYKLKWSYYPMQGNALLEQDEITDNDMQSGQPKTLHLKFGGADY